MKFLNSFLAVSVGVLSVNISSAATGIAVGEYTLLPSLEVAIEHDDNIFRSNTNEDSSLVTRVTPSLVLENTNERRDIAFQYDIEAVNYFDSADDNYASHIFAFDGLFNVAKNNQLTANIGLEKGHEARGTQSTQGAAAAVANEPTKFTATHAAVGYNYGKTDAPLYIELAAEFSELEFDNFRATTAGRDRDENTLSAKLAYNFSSASAAFLSLSYADFDYSNNLAGKTFALDSTQNSAHIGFEWSATRKTRGSISLGVTSKDVDQVNVKSTASSWNIDMAWYPSEGSSVLVQSSKAPQESPGIGVYIDTIQTGVSYIRKISSRWTVDAFVSAVNSDYENDAREDDIEAFGAGLVYQMNQKSQLALRFENEDKDSNDNQFDFERNVISLVFQTSL